MVNSRLEKPGTRRGLTLTEVLVIVAILAMFMAFVLPTIIGNRRHHGPFIHCRNNLKSIVLALHSYKDDYGVFRSAFTVDMNGNPLHSWRTLLLPYLDQLELYESIDLSKAWDDPANAKAFEQMPGFYACPQLKGKNHRTPYLGLVGPGRCFAGAAPRKVNEITDNHAETLMVVEVHADQGVPWMAPVDADEKLILDVDPKSKWLHDGRRNVAFVDGSVRTLIASETTAAELKRMMTVAGGD